VSPRADETSRLAGSDGDVGECTVTPHRGPGVGLFQNDGKESRRPDADTSIDGSSAH
jgi:hypothetical protein